MDQSSTKWCLFSWLLLTAVTIAADAETQAQEKLPATEQPVRVLPSSFSATGIPIFTNSSVKQLNYTEPAPALIYTRLQQTCNFWNKRYRKERSELSRLNMNSACREASLFARQRLNKKVATHLVPYTTARKSKTASSRAVFIGKQREAHPGSCEKWRKRIDTITRQLRAGYKESRGNRLRQQRRELSDRIYRSC